MNFVKKTSSSATIPVSMLDVTRQNGPLQHELSAAIDEVCRSGAFVHGPACARFEKQMAEYCRVDHAIGCASGSDALLLALMVLGIGEGDEVILPSFTFFATAGAVWRLGARPVFADILPTTFNIDPADVERKITKRTRAILPVHLFGQCADMDRLLELGADAGVAVIEDAAQAIGAEWRGRRAGGIGSLGCFSFYPTKNLGGLGDGGLITTNNGDLAARLRVLRDHGQQPRYHHHLVGINSRLDAIQAAALSVKLPQLSKWARQRERHASRYTAEFIRRGIAREVIAPVVEERGFSVWNQYTVRVAGGRRDALQKYLAERQIGSAVYYPIPLHLQACFASLGSLAGSLPVTEQAAREVLSLPVYPELTAIEQNVVIDAVASFCQSHGRAAA